MFKSPRIMAWGVFLGIVVSACRNAATPRNPEKQPGSAPSPEILRIGPARFTLDDFRRFCQGVENGLNIPDQVRPSESTELLNRFVVGRLFVVAAKAEQVGGTEEERRQVAAALGLNSETAANLPEEELLVGALMKARGICLPEAGEPEYQAYYEAHRSEFELPEGWHVYEILVNDAALAQRLFQELVSGGKGRFVRYARQFSVSPSRDRGGDIGVFHPGELPPEFERVIRALQPGNLSAVLHTQYGHHLFYLDEIVKAHPARFREVQEQIRDRVRQQGERRCLETLLTALFDAYRPVLLPHSLGFALDRSVLNPKITVEESYAP